MVTDPPFVPREPDPGITFVAADSVPLKLEVSTTTDPTTKAMPVGTKSRNVRFDTVPSGSVMSSW